MTNPKITVSDSDRNEDKNKKSSILSVRVKRDDKLGLQLMVKSSIDWGQFKGDGISNISGVACFNPRDSRAKGVSGYFHRGAGYDVLYYENLPNLIILLAKDINDGVTFNLGMFPISEDSIKKWTAALKEQVKVLYLTYCKPFEIRVEFSTQTVEIEQHD